MIEVDQQHLSHQLTRFNQTMVEYITVLKVAPQAFVKRQTSMLSRTLVNISPKATRKNIEKAVNAKFPEESSGPTFEDYNTTKAGHGNVRWVKANSKVLIGVLPELDLRHASAQTLYELMLIRGKNGAGRTFQRGKQKVRIISRYLASKAAKAELTKRLVGHIGRLCAAWATSWEDTGRHGPPLPQYVSKHVSGSRSLRKGFSINGLLSSSGPSFTIGNRAKGAENLLKNAGEFVRQALRIRKDAMAADIRFAIKNPKKWREREANSELRQIVNSM